VYFPVRVGRKIGTIDVRSAEEGKRVEGKWRGSGAICNSGPQEGARVLPQASGEKRMAGGGRNFSKKEPGLTCPQTTVCPREKLSWGMNDFEDCEKSTGREAVKNKT